MDSLTRHIEQAAKAKDFHSIVESIQMVGEALPDPLGGSRKERLDFGLLPSDAFGGGAWGGGAKVGDKVGDGGIGFVPDGGDDGD